MRALAQVLEAILPALCGVCRAPVAANGALCAACWGQLSFINKPFCDCCGVPFSLPSEEGTCCALCLAQPPAYSKARAALVYDDAARTLISQLKYGDKLHLLPAFAPWLQRAAAELLQGADLIIPVPLHWTRLWRRRFNQALLLARLLGRPVNSRLLLRTRRTPRQVGLTRDERLKNVRDAFIVRGDVQGKTIVLVDDVYTTGATLAACTQALQEAGAKDVRVLTLARVVILTQVDG